MSLLGFQRALSDLVMSPGFRAAAGADPEAAFAAFELSARERERLVALAGDPGLRTGTFIHRSFRLSILSNSIPRTCKALGSRGIKELVGEYWRDHGPRSYYYAQEATRFGEFALARLRQGGLGFSGSLLLPEVLLTELAMLDLRREEAWPGAAAGPPALSGTACLHPLCRVVRWRCDPEAALAALEAGRVPEDLPPGEHYLVVTAAGARRVARHAIAVAWGRALQAVAESGARELAPGAPAAAELAAAGYLLFSPA
jgi:hypothetical protein